MNARFNGLYIAKVQLNESLNNLKANHVDDFNQILTVFPYGTPEQQQAEKGNLEEVFKKSSNVIKKHPKSNPIYTNTTPLPQSKRFSTL